MRPKRIITCLVVALAVAFSDGSVSAQGKGKKPGGGGGKGEPGAPVFVVLKGKAASYEVATVDASGVVVATLATGMDARPPAPSPDGKRMALYLPAGASGSGIYITATDASTAPYLLVPTRNYVWGLAWSPVATADGDFKIAWTEEDAQGSALHLVNEDGSEHTVLRQGNDFYGHIEFSPDARWIGVPSPDATGFGLLELVNVGGTLTIGTVRRPVNGTFSAGTSAPSWISANEVVFSGAAPSGTSGVNLYRVDLRGGPPQLIVADRSFGDYQPTRPDAHLPTGKLLFEAYAYGRKGGVTIFTCEADGSGVTQVTSKGLWRLPRWL